MEKLLVFQDPISKIAFFTMHDTFYPMSVDEVKADLKGWAHKRSFHISLLALANSDTFEIKTFMVKNKDEFKAVLNDYRRSKHMMFDVLGRPTFTAH